MGVQGEKIYLTPLSNANEGCADNNVGKNSHEEKARRGGKNSTELNRESWEKSTQGLGGEKDYRR